MKLRESIKCISMFILFFCFKQIIHAETAQEMFVRSFLPPASTYACKVSFNDGPKIEYIYFLDGQGYLWQSSQKQEDSYKIKTIIMPDSQITLYYFFDKIEGIREYRKAFQPPQKIIVDSAKDNQFSSKEITFNGENALEITRRDSESGEISTVLIVSQNNNLLFQYQAFTNGKPYSKMTYSDYDFDVILSEKDFDIPKNAKIKIAKNDKSKQKIVSEILNHIITEKIANSPISQKKPSSFWDTIKQYITLRMGLALLAVGTIFAAVILKRKQK